MTTKEHTRRNGSNRRLTALILVSLVALGLVASGIAVAGSAAPRAAVRVWTSTTPRTTATTASPTSCSPPGTGPRSTRAIPVIISPHGRNANRLSNTKYFGNLPAIGRFAVISPDGMGRTHTSKSYGYKGQIDDLAKMPEFAEARASRGSASTGRASMRIGSSMGGHETLCSSRATRDLLAGAAAMDSVTDLSRRY